MAENIPKFLKYQKEITENGRDNVKEVMAEN